MLGQYLIVNIIVIIMNNVEHIWDINKHD
jgi:hypothetical protein